MNYVVSFLEMPLMQSSKISSYLADTVKIELSFEIVKIVEANHGFCKLFDDFRKSNLLNLMTHSIFIFQLNISKLLIIKIIQL